jgi:sugar-phosphatase
VIEDSFNGLLAAKSARMKCITVPEKHNRKNPKFCIADKQINSLLEINEELWSNLL